MTPDLVFRDPYIPDFLSLSDTFSENDLESVLTRQVASGLVMQLR